MLLEVILALEGLAAGFAREGDVVLVGALVDHEVVGLGEASLAVLADEFALCSHFAPELTTVLRLNGHYGKHCNGETSGRAGETDYSITENLQQVNSVKGDDRGHGKNPPPLCNISSPVMCNPFSGTHANYCVSRGM